MRKRSAVLLISILCLMPVTLAGCAGQHDAGSSGDQQQAAEEQAAR